jgi:PAS domain S-box-containing protein
MPAEMAAPNPFLSDSAALQHLPVIAYTADRHGAIRLIHELGERDGHRFAPLQAAWFRRIHASDRKRARQRWLAAVATGMPYEDELRFGLDDGTYRWFLCRAVPVRDASGTLEGYAGTAVDIEAQKRAERDLRALGELHETVSGRERLYARLSEELSGSVSLDETIEVLLQAIVPAYADWMSVYLEKREGDGFEVIAMRHWDEKRRPLVEALLGTSFATEGSATAEVLRTGKPILLERYPDSMWKRAILPEYTAHLRTLGLRSAIVVPFRHRDRVIGAIHVIRGDNPANFAHEDLMLVEELARRITPAIHRAEAYERERMVARHFQEAALPTVLLETPTIEVDAVYEAAKTEATVGGDWYDAFHIDQERLLISVGDVGGHGLRAATIMAMLRQSLRALSLTSTSPAQLMHLLRQLMAKEYPDDYATAFIGIIWPRTGRFEYISAGHPAPLLRLRTGRVRELRGGRYPLLGVSYSKPASASTTTLEPGSLLVLFTDGLTEVSRNVIEGERQLRTIVASPEVGSARDPAHVIHKMMLPKGSFDDAAVLCIRVLARTGTREAAESLHFGLREPGLAADKIVGRQSIDRSAYQILHGLAH